MPVRIRFTGPATLNSTITISWSGGYPPGATVTAVETFKTLRAASFQTTIASDPEAQAIAYYAALTTDFGANFAITRIGADVIVNPLNGTQNVTATTTSANITINPSVSQVAFINEPQYFVPVYNPVTFKFFSANYSVPGHRYLANVYKTTNGLTETVANFKVTPNIDGTGYIDISKVLSNYTSVDWVQSESYIDNCENSYVNYELGIGEEFSTNWQFSEMQYVSSGTYTGKVKLVQSPTITAHTYVAGDQINISSTVTGTNTIINGLHTVVNVPSAYSIIIEVVNPGTSTVTTDGITSYADGRKTSYNDVETFTGIAFNGARSWIDFPNWDWEHWFIQYGIYQSPDCELLTSLRINTETSDNLDNHFYMTSSQSLWLNFAVDDPDKVWTVEWSSSNADGSIGYDSGSFIVDAGSGNNGNVKQFKINPDELIGLSTSYDLIEKIIFRVVDDLDEPVTRYYAVYLDKRCRIEKYELYFMDRMGSILSFACQLRAKETGTITRESGKQQIQYNETSTSYTDVYSTTDRGTIINSVNLNKDLELNTNWMNNEMSLLFEELLTSPYVWLRTVYEPTSELSERNVYTAVTVNETSFQVEKQKNKRLIRKTVTVKMANENIINI